MNKTPSVLLAVFACAAAATAEPVVPGEFTDPTNLRKATEGLSTGWFVPPEGMKFPYVSTYYVTPTVTAGDKVTIPFYVTDWNHSKVRFGDDTHRFTMRLKCVGPDGAAVERELRDVPSGDGAFTLDAPGEGEYDVGVWAVDAKGRESHRVWHRFRVMNAADVGVAKRETYAMVADDLEAYEISNEGDLGRKVLVDAETVGDADVQDVKPRDGAPGYTVFIPAPGGRVRAGSTHRSKIVYDEGYDAEAVEAAALKTLEGLQRLLDDKAAAGFHKVVLLPGTYRISAKGKIRLPDRMTLDLNGATLKENGFAGCGALMVSISAVRDAHLVNGTLEGDYYEHDYANSEKNSEWVNGFGISGSAMYCSVENVVVRDITGYGGGNGMGKGGANGGYTTFLKGVGKYVPGLLNARDGTLDASVEGCFTADYVRLPDNADRLQVSAYLGYQGIRTRQWQLLGCWYDKDKKFISSETLFQYRVVPKPAGAAYLRFTEVNSSAKVAGKDDLNLTCFNVPQNCEVKNCTFDRCRCVGYAASAMKNMLFENNLFTHSGESSAKCAFDAEDGWDQMQDVTFRGNRCVDNPFNSRLLTCAGHNFVFEGNKCGFYFWGRTYSPCVRDNTEVGTATFMCDGRNRSGYGRFERNTYTGSVSIPGGRTYGGWEHVLAGLSFGGDTNLVFSFGAASRLRECRFADATIVSPSLVSACAIENCKVKKPACARWLGVVMTGGSMESLHGTNRFDRCTFKGAVVAKAERGSLSVFADCAFDACRFDGFDGGSVVFSNCVFKGSSVCGRAGDGPASVEFADCSFETAGEPAAAFAACGVRNVAFRRCSVTTSPAGADMVVSIFDLKPGNDGVKGDVVFEECRFGPGVKCAVDVAKAGQDASKRKEIEFTFKANKFTEKGVSPVRNIMPQWKVTRVRRGQK